MKIARLTDYAFLILTTLRGQAQLNAAHLAVLTKVPETTVSKILKTLTRAGLVASTRGAQGGYKLAQPAEQITLVAVIEAMEGPIAMTHCTQEMSKPCVCAPICSNQTQWRDVNGIIRGALANVSLLELGLPLL